MNLFKILTIWKNQKTGSYNYGVAERWVYIKLFFLRIKQNKNNPSENADMSNEKGKSPSPKAYGIINVTASKFIA